MAQADQFANTSDSFPLLFAFLSRENFWQVVHESFFPLRYLRRMDFVVRGDLLT